MPKRRRAKPQDSKLADKLTSRIGELELRLQLLEARVRRVTAEAKAQATGKPVRMEPVKPRCPGCLIEFSRNLKKSHCEWCGFDFSAVGRRAIR